MPELVSTSGMPDQIVKWYTRTALEPAMKKLPWGRFGETVVMPKNQGSQPVFSRYENYDVNKNALTEGIPRDPSAWTRTDITGQIEWYGNSIKFTDQVILTNRDPILTKFAKVNGRNAADTLDQVYMNVLIAGTSVYYAGGVANRASVSTKMTKADLRKCVRTLRIADASPKDEQLIPASTGYGTQSIPPAYFAIVDAYGEHDLKKEIGSDFIPVNDYPDPSKAYEDEIGAFEDIRFIKASNHKVWEDSGDTAASGEKSTSGTNGDVHCMVIFAKEAYGIVPIGSKNFEYIVHRVGSAGALDPLNQFGTAGWKAGTDCLILNEDFMLRYEFLVND